MNSKTNEHTHRNNLSKGKTYQLALIGVMTAITCILGPLSISIPFSPVPISFTNLAIYLTIFILGMRRGVISYFIYLLLGLVGVPVFSAFSAGPGKLLGPTGGYLIGFIFMAIICGFFVEQFQRKWIYFLGFTLATIAAYFFGTFWLSYQASMSFSQAFLVGVVPYIPGDFIKIFISIFIGTQIRNRLKRAGILL